MPNAILLDIAIKAWLVNELESARFNGMFAVHLCICSGVIAIRLNFHCSNDHVFLYRFNRDEIIEGLTSYGWDHVCHIIKLHLGKEPSCRLRLQNPDLNPDE